MKICITYKMLQHKQINVSEGIEINKSNKSKGVSKVLIIRLSHMFVVNVTIYQ